MVNYECSPKAALTPHLSSIFAKGPFGGLCRSVIVFDARLQRPSAAPLPIRRETTGVPLVKTARSSRPTSPWRLPKRLSQSEVDRRESCYCARATKTRPQDINTNNACAVRGRGEGNIRKVGVGIIIAMIGVRPAAP